MSKELQCDNFAVYSVDIYYFPCRFLLLCINIVAKYVTSVIPSFVRTFVCLLLGSLASLFVSFVRLFGWSVGRSLIWCNAPIHIRNHPHIHAFSLAMKWRNGERINSHYKQSALYEYCSNDSVQNCSNLRIRTQHERLQ